MKFKMNGIEYEIYEGNQIEFKEKRLKEDEEQGCEKSDVKSGVYNGSTNYPLCYIFLDDNLPVDRKRKILLHELTHCYIAEYVTHSEQQYTEEDVADVCANSHDIIHDIVEKYFNS